MTEREKTAAEYARRQWPDTAPEEYVEGSKEDYLAGYDAAVTKALKWLREQGQDWWEGYGLPFNTDDFKKAMEE